MSSFISSTERRENLRPLYTGQNRHWFQGQFLVNLNNKLLASFGGRIGPCSKLNKSLSFSSFSAIDPFPPLQQSSARGGDNACPAGRLRVDLEGVTKGL
jgi:hypothetical protein